jgi:hypothetical protein
VQARALRLQPAVGLERPLELEPVRAQQREALRRVAPINAQRVVEVELQHPRVLPRRIAPLEQFAHARRPRLYAGLADWLALEAAKAHGGCADAQAHTVAAHLQPNRLPVQVERCQRRTVKTAQGNLPLAFLHPQAQLQLARDV